jgi:hypothetical protein
MRHAPRICVAISLADYFMGRDRLHAAELSAALRTNAALTVERANALLARAGIAGTVNSGWRPQAINAALPNASPRSKHLSCQAIDLDDEDDALDTWCLRNLSALEEIGLWLEHPDATPGWCHVQIVPPRSGCRVFNP